MVPHTNKFMQHSHDVIVTGVANVTSQIIKVHYMLYLLIVYIYFCSQWVRSFELSFCYISLHYTSYTIYSAGAMISIRHHN